MSVDYMAIYQSKEPIYDGLPKKVQEAVTENLASRRSFLLAQMDRCESPIEQLLYVQLMELADSLRKELPIFDTYTVASVQPQWEVKVDESKYRVDFQFFVQVGWVKKKYIIECDGHDFHERTKEQAARDRKRDRQMTKAGYTVIRFTGSEIWKNAASCVSQLEEIIQADFDFEEAYSRHFEEYGY